MAMCAAYFGRLCSLPWTVLLCVLSSGAAYAEGGCPPGERPINTTPPEGSAASMASCMPYETETPAVRWANRWGAVADDGAGAFGASANESSKKKAQKAAIADCKKNGGAQCNVYMTYSNQCIAHATSDVSSNTARAPDEASARQDSLAGCAKSGNGRACRIHYTASSLAVRVR